MKIVKTCDGEPARSFYNAIQNLSHAIKFVQ